MTVLQLSFELLASFDECVCPLHLREREALKEAWLTLFSSIQSRVILPIQHSQ
jgi:hypothetical protein